MINKYFQQELSNLREIAGEFSKEKPALAPMLGEAASDPDVERVAFLTGSIRERMSGSAPGYGWIVNYVYKVLKDRSSTNKGQLYQACIVASSSLKRDVEIALQIGG